MDDYFPTSEPSSEWIQQPFIDDMSDNKQLNLHEQHLKLQGSQAAKTTFSSLLYTDEISEQYAARIS